MKRLIFLLLIGTGIIFTSCRKNLNDDLIPTTPKTMDELEIPSDFNWKTIKDFQLTLTGYANSIVEVTSPQGTVYQKAFLTKNEPYSIKLTVPTYEKSIRLKYMGQIIELELASNEIEYVFN